MKHETDLARKVSTWLAAAGWDVFAEVGDGDGRADIVATRDRLVRVVECKMALTFAVIAQAIGWRASAHYVHVAVPSVRRHDGGRGFALRVCRDHGIGVLAVARVALDFEAPVREDERAALLRRPPGLERLRKRLVPEARTYADPGNADSRYWSPFKATCEAVVKAVSRRPGIGTRDLISAIEHHYRCDSTARSSLLKWAERGKIPGVRVERAGKGFVWQPSTEARVRA